MINKIIRCFICFSLLVNFFIPSFSVFAEVQSVMITELMVDPEKVPDSKGEWIEVFNKSSIEINLNDWIINDDGKDHKPILGNYIIPPNGYAVICRNDKAQENGGVKCDYSVKMTLSNKDNTVILKDANGNIIDQITYTKEDVKKTKGKSINISDNTARTVSIENTFTYGMGDFGTPAKNTVSIGTHSFPTIQNALNASLEKDAINVAKGEYYENLSIQKEVKLIGEGVGKTIIFNNNCNDAVVTINTDNVSISNFAFNDNKCNYQVVRIDKGTGIVIEENEITKGSIGIAVYNALGNNANKNLIRGNKVGVQNNDLSNVFDARFNFWDDASGPLHKSLNPDGKGNSVSDSVIFRPFYRDLQKTTLSTFSISKGEFNPTTFFSSGAFSLPTGAIDEKDTASVVVNEQMTISVEMLDGSHRVDLPSGVVITKSGGGTIDATKLSADNMEIASFSGFDPSIVVEGGLQWGIPDFGLQFSKAVTLNIFVGTAKNGQTLSVVRSVSKDSNWTSDGIVFPATCTVSLGMCTFQATRASYFAATAIVPTPTPTPTPTPASSVSSSTSESKDSNSNSQAKAPTCDDAKPGSSPTLLSALPGINSVTLNWSKALDPVTHYLVAFGREHGTFEFGNPNIGNKDSTSYTVYGLSARTSYYFKVLAVNNCKPGDFSNELSAKAFGATKSLAKETSALETLGIASDQEIYKEDPLRSNVIPSTNIFTQILNLFSAFFSLFGRLFN